MGFTMFRRYDTDQVGSYLCSDGIEDTSLTIHRLRQPTHAPFGHGVSTSFAVLLNDGTYGNSFALTLLISSWLVLKLRLLIATVRALLTLLSLLTGSAGEVRDFLT